MTILSDFSKLIFMFIIAYLLKVGINFIVAFITTTALRVIAGGFHFKRYWTCLLFSFCYYTLLIWLSYWKVSLFCLSTICCIICPLFIILTPTLTPQRKYAYKVKSMHAKIMTFTLLVIYLFIYLIKQTSIASLGIWTIILQFIQIVIMKGKNFYEKKKKYNMV